MKISLEERDIIRRILNHADAGTTDMMGSVLHNPISNYACPDKLEQEMSILFREFPIIVGHSSDLAEPGSFFTYNDLGAPVLLTRTRKGEAKAFLNVCRHRGARVEDKPCGKASVFSCPYHSWTYDLEGKLRGIPHAEGFEGVNKDDLGLVALPCFERFGFIWLVPSVQQKEIDIDAWLAPMAEQLGGLSLDKHVVFKKWTLNRNMSWRLALEGFQESYHFCHAHRTTACAGYLDNQAVFLDQYPHVRHAVPLPKATELASVPEEDWEHRPYFMTQNYLFPANFIQVMTDHVYVHTIIPTGPGTCIFQCMMLIEKAPETEKSQRYWEKNYELIRTVFNEDFEIGENIQKGLNSGANSAFVFGMNECALHYGQQAIDDALAGKLKLPML